MKKKLILAFVSIFILSLVLTVFAACTVSYKVTFNTQGGSTIESQTVESGKTATKPTTDPTKTDYNFKGWSKKADSLDAFDFTATITANTTIYAIWEAKGTTIQNSAATQALLAASGKVKQKPEVVLSMEAEGMHADLVFIDGSLSLMYMIMEDLETGFAMEFWMDSDYAYMITTMGPSTYYSKMSANAPEMDNYKDGFASGLDSFFEEMKIPSNAAFKAGSDNNVITFSDEDGNYEITLENGLITTIVSTNDEETVTMTFTYSKGNFEIPNHPWVEV